MFKRLVADPQNHIFKIEVIGNSPDLRLIESIRKFYEASLPKLDWKKSNGQSYPAGCPTANGTAF